MPLSRATLLLLMASTSAHSAEVRFADRTAELGFEHIYGGGWEHFVGGGMASFDCNGDNFPDVFLAGGENPSQLLINTTQGQGDTIAFSDKTSAASALTGVTGAYPINIDNDAHIDLFVMRVGENIILRGKANCEFENANTQLGFDGLDQWTASFAATWEQGNEMPTLAIGNYVDRNDPEGPFNACDTNKLYRPDGDGTYGAPITLEPGYCALSMLISDWTRQGRRDLRISNDRHYYVRDGEEQMWRLDEMRPLTREDGWLPISVWGMGIASQDLNGDMAPDIVLTSMGDQLMQFYVGGAAMENAPFDIGAYAHRPYTGDDGRPSTGWHAEFGDVNNDGLPDLFIAKGNVDQMPGMATKDPNNMLIQQPDGTFVERGLEAGLASMVRGRGAALVDFNLDGRLDVAVVNRRAPFEVFENISTDTGNFLALDVQQEGVNTHAIGAWVEVKANDKLQTQEITIGGGHASGEIGPVHFGLGDAETVQIRILWPDGEKSAWANIRANQFVRVRRGEGSELDITPSKTRSN